MSTYWMIAWGKGELNIFSVWHLTLFLSNVNYFMQVLATCNVEQSFFNDWFTGHLNFQIEHQWVIETTHEQGRGSDL